MKKTVSVIVLAGALALGLTACATPEHPTHSAKASAVAKATPTPTPTPTPDGTAAHPYPQGTVTVTDPGSSWDVTLTDLNSNATDQVKAQDSYATLAAGDQYVMGTITATVNKDAQASNLGQTTTVSGSLTPVFVGGDGKIYSGSTDPASDATITNDWINVPSIVYQVGVKSSGAFAIPVPTSAVAGGHFGIENSVSNHIVYFQ
jgi:hypothetical protein